jgi:hypothetical protein
MTNGDHAEFQIQWIEMTFNTSGPYTGMKSDEKRSLPLLEKRGKRKICGNVCKIDDVKQLGTPEIVHYGEDGEESDGLSAGAKAGIAIGVILGVAIVAAIAYFFWRRRKGAMMTTKKGKEGYELTNDAR